MMAVADTNVVVIIIIISVTRIYMCGYYFTILVEINSIRDDDFRTIVIIVVTNTINALMKNSNDPDRFNFQIYLPLIILQLGQVEYNFIDCFHRYPHFGRFFSPF